jgi:hypothetical protein
MRTWHHDDSPRYPAPRPDRPSNPQLLDAPEFSDESEGIELDMMRRNYVNLCYECAELEAIVAHIRTSNAPFTGKDLSHLDEAVALMRVGFKAMKKVIKHERRWSMGGTLEEE